MEEKLCLDCGTPITAGRSDKKFCGDICRTNYNNNLEKEDAEPPVAKFIKTVQAALVRNREILDEFLGEKEKASLDKIDLDGRGFTFKYFTSQSKTKGSGETYNFCFELGYKVSEDDRVVIVRRPRENHLLK